MRKILIGVLIIILIAGITFTLISGIALGSIQISSMQQLATKDKEIEDDISKLKSMKEETFSNAMDELIKETQRLKNNREEYAALVNAAAEENFDAIVTSEKYQIEYLWVKLGNYATKNGVTLKLNVLNNSKGLSGVYDLQFAINGKYVGITEFVYEIENDSTLGFRIEEFLLVPGTLAQSSTTQDKDTDNKNTNTTNDTETVASTTTDILTATFIVRDIEIDISSQQANNVTNALDDKNTEDNNIGNSSDNAENNEVQ